MHANLRNWGAVKWGWGKVLKGWVYRSNQNNCIFKVREKLLRTVVIFFIQKEKLCLPLPSPVMVLLELLAQGSFPPASSTQPQQRQSWQR